jgi:hypothetical protein
VLYRKRAVRTLQHPGNQSLGALFDTALRFLANNPARAAP